MAPGGHPQERSPVVEADELRRLERELGRDWEEPGRTERLDGMVQEYLMHRAGDLAGARVKGEADLLKLIHTYSRVELIRQLIQNPKGFNMKDMKELFRSTLIVEQNDAAERARSDELLKAITMTLSPSDQKALTAGLTGVAKDRVRDKIKELNP